MARDMSDDLKIDFAWIEGNGDLAAERAFFAKIGLSVGPEWLTVLEDRLDGTWGTHLRACAHRLATWFAANWWRLRWEPQSPNCLQDPDWCIAHSTAAAGGGFVWPNITFASEGVKLSVWSHPRKTPAAFESIRYLNCIEALVSAVEFERAVDTFLAAVISRHHSLCLSDQTLPKLWAEVQGERRNPEASQWRKLEALCGYDPDEAPEGLVAELLQDPAHLGAPALEEVAAQGRHKVATVLRQILALADANGQSNQGGFRCTIPDLTGPSAKLSDAAPHDLGARLARQARQEWNLGRKPIRNEKLAELLGTEPGVFARSPAAISPMIMALRPPKSGEFDFYINQSPTTSRRFATARLIADHLQFCNGGRLLPATSAGTQRQKVQRAFAQEFLCPIDALLEKIQTEQPDEYDFAEAADFFDVSPLLVKAALVNHGHLDREALSWAN